MKREIKFRAWHKGYPHKGNINYGEVMLFDEKHGDCLRYLADGQPVEVMQFTGLKDKNGVEIYEGDILDNGTGHYIGAVEFKNGSFLHRDSPLWFYVEDGVIEDNRDDPDGKITLQESDTNVWAIVIGNIYENPELLTKQL